MIGTIKGSEAASAMDTVVIIDVGPYKLHGFQAST